MSKYQKALDDIRSVIMYDDDSILEDYSILHAYDEKGKIYKFDSAEALSNLQAVINKYEGYMWHDLRKDPKDLPLEEGYYLCKVGAQACPYRVMMFKQSNEGYGLDDPKADKWREYNDSYVYNQFVLAWKEIEKFK